MGLWKKETMHCSKVNRHALPRQDTCPDAYVTDGRLKAACELLSQYLPKDLYEQLLASFEYVFSVELKCNLEI